MSIRIFIVCLVGIAGIGWRPAAAAAVTDETAVTTTTVTPTIDPDTGMGTSGVNTPAASFDAIQITWVVDGDPAAVPLQLATATDGRWSPWETVTHADEFLLPDAVAGTQTSTILTLPARAAQWQIQYIPTGKTTVTVRSLRVTTIRTGATADPSSIVAAALPLAGGRKPAIVARTTWGDAAVKQWDANGVAGASSHATWMPTDAEIARPTHIIIHHTATPNTDTDWPARVRQIWGYHTISNDWGDIGYHYLVDPNGVIYEGRFRGVRSDGTVIDGAHDYGFNRGTIGISMLGSYDSTLPTAAAQTALDNLVAYLATNYRITPDTTAYYARQGVTLNTIIGHRDAQVAGYSTACPGTLLHTLLPGIRTKAKANLGTAPTQQWLTGVAVVDSDVSVGDAVVFRMTVRNPYPDLAISGAAFRFLTADTNALYTANECWAKTNTQGAALYPKAATQTDRYTRFRVMAGVTGWDAQFADTVGKCPTASTVDHPWRWSIGKTPLLPGATRVVSGQVRFTTPGTYTVTFGVMKDWIGYPDNQCSDAPSRAACGLFPRTIVVRSRATPTSTTLPALATQLAGSTSTAVVATATAQAAVLARTATTLSDELTATAIATSGAATYTASPTTTHTPTATPIALAQTVTHWLGQTATRAAERTALAASGTPGVTVTPTRSRTPTVQPFLNTRSATSTTANVSTLIPVGSQLVSLAPSSNRLTLWDATSLAAVQTVSFRGTSASLLATADATGTEFFVAGNFTARYIAVQRFRIIGGKARDAGYWIVPFTGTPRALLAQADTLTLAVTAANGTTSRLIRLRSGPLLAEAAPRLTLPGPARGLSDVDGVGGLVVATGTQSGTHGYLLAADFRSATPRGSTVLTTSPLPSPCRRWALVAGQPVAQLLSSDDRGAKHYTVALATGVISGPAATSPATALLACPSAAPQVVVTIHPTSGLVSVWRRDTGTRPPSLRATGTLPHTTGTRIVAAAVSGTTIWWSDGITLRRITTRALDYY